MHVRIPSGRRAKAPTLRNRMREMVAFGSGVVGLLLRTPVSI